MRPYGPRRKLRPVGSPDGELIRAARLARGWTMDRCAAELGTQPPVICMWESGRRSPRVNEAARVARVLGIDLRQLSAGRELVAALDAYAREIALAPADSEAA